MILATLRALTFTLATIPEAANRTLAALLGDAVFFLLPRRRRIILSNLSHAFPDRPHEWLVRMGRTSCRRMIEVGMIAIAAPRLSAKRLKRMVRMDDESLATLNRIFEDPRPAVLAFPHLGAWELAGAFLTLLDHPPREVGCMYRPLNHPKLNAWLESTRNRHGVRMLSRRQGFSEAMGIMRRGGFFALLFDQSAGPNGTLSLFFDRVCSSTNLPGLMTEKFGARLVVFYVKRTDFWRYTATLHLPDDLPHDADAVAGRLDEWLTRTLRSDEDLCASWLWAHNRWKVQRDPRKRFGLHQKRSALPSGAVPRNERFLIRLPDGFGESLTALPLVRALRASRFDAVLTALAAPHSASLLKHSDLFESVLELPARPDRRAFLRSLRPTYPDAWIDLSGNSEAGSEGKLTGCPQRFGITHADDRRRGLNHAWTPPGPIDGSTANRIHCWEQFLRHFGLRGEVELSPVDFRGLPRPLDDRAGGARWVGLHVGAQTGDDGRWTAAAWRALIEHVLDTDPAARVVLLGEAVDRIFANDIGAHGSHDRVTDLVGKLNAAELAGAMEQCDVVVTASPSAMLLANELGTQLVALFGPLGPLENGPPFLSPAWILQPTGCPETGGIALSELSWEPVAETTLRTLSR